jgi:hypothetical protein
MGESDAASRTLALSPCSGTCWNSLAHRTRRYSLRSSGCTWIIRCGRFGVPWAVEAGPRCGLLAPVRLGRRRRCSGCMRPRPRSWMWGCIPLTLGNRHRVRARVRSFRLDSITRAIPDTCPIRGSRCHRRWRSRDPPLGQRRIRSSRRPCRNLRMISGNGTSFRDATPQPISDPGPAAGPTRRVGSMEAAC